LAAFRELCDCLHTHKVDIIALQELNLDTTQFQVRQQILNVLRETFGAVKMVTASTPVQKETTLKPGGVLLAMVGNCSHQVTNTTRDPFGGGALLPWQDKTTRISESTALTNVLLRTYGTRDPPPTLRNCGDCFGIKIIVTRNHGDVSSETYMLNSLQQGVTTSP
jgi:hypothetical protein